MGLSGFKFLLKTPTDDTKAFQSSRPAALDFVTIGGMRSNSLEMTAQDIDITNKSTGENRTILNRQGIRTLNSSGSGVLLNDPLIKAIELNLNSQKIRWFRLEREDGRSFTARFKINSFSSEGAHDSEVTFSISLMSSGTLYVSDVGGLEYDTGVNRITAFNDLAASIGARKTISANYDLADIPEESLRASAIKTHVDALNPVALAALSLQTLEPDTDLTLDGASEANKFSFPVLFLNKSNIENRTLQVLDSLEFVLDVQPVGSEVTISGVEYIAYFINVPLGNGEELIVNVSAG